MTAIATEAVQMGRSAIDVTYLPTGRMRQITRVDGITETTIAGVVALDQHWVFAEHFPGDPIFPGALMVEAAGQLVALHAWHRGNRGRPRLVKTAAQFHRPVGVEHAELTLLATIRLRRHISFSTVHIHVGPQLVADVEIVLAVLPET